MLCKHNDDSNTAVRKKTPPHECNLITFTPPHRQEMVQEVRREQLEPKRQRTPRKRKQRSEWSLNQRQFDQNKQQEISHILPVDQVNVFNSEEPSMSYLQLPTRKSADDNRLCSKCGDPGHWKQYCQATMWCRFCTSETHATRACRRYANFVRDNLIASSRRTTPKQPEPHRAQPQQEMDMRQLFPQPPRQCFQAPVVPPAEARGMQYPMPQQAHLQRNSQDVRADPHFRPPPPQYSQVQQHRHMHAPLVEVNELEPSIQQGVMQRPTRKVQPDRGTRFENRNQTRSVPQNQRDSSTNQISGPEENGGDRLSNCNENSFPEDYIVNCFHEGKPYPWNDLVRPVFMNHYYAGEPVLPTTSNKYIRLDECDDFTETLARNPQLQIFNRQTVEQSQDSLRSQMAAGKEVGSETVKNIQSQTRRFHSEFIEPSQHSLGTLNVGRSRVQAASCVDPQQVPLTGYEEYPQEVQTYPVARAPVNVQPVAPSNGSALLDLPNVQTDLPTPLTPQQVSHAVTGDRGRMRENAQQDRPNADMVTSSQILESIQNITRVMQQQLVFNGKITEARLLQTVGLFKEMIKAQEKSDLDPALMAIPTFLGQAADRPQCLDWVSRVKNVCDQSGRSFQQNAL